VRPLLEGHGKVAVSVLDQLLLSALNLLIGAAFVVLSPKEEYGNYVLVFGFLLLLSSIQNALVNTPLTANGSKLTGEARARFIEGMYGVQTAACVVTALVLGVGVWLWPVGDRHGHLVLAAATVVAVFGSWMREFRRTEGFLEQRPTSVLWGDLAYVALCCAALGVELAVRHRLSATGALMWVGLAGILTGLRRPSALRPPDWVLLWPQVRWTLPNVVVTWLQGNSFPYFAAIIAGTRGAADLAAARLFVMPISLLAVGWARVFQPQAGEKLADSDPEAALAMARTGALQLFSVGIGYGVLLLGFGALGGWRLLPAQYSGITTPIILWWIYFLVSSTRGVATVGLIAHLAFKQLFSFSVVTALASVPLMIVAGRWLGPEFIILGMALGEGLLAAVSWRQLLHVSGCVGSKRASLGFA
jgi:O-antigen/teichoic acid export membrane protein